MRSMGSGIVTADKQRTWMPIGPSPDISQYVLVDGSSTTKYLQAA